MIDIMKKPKRIEISFKDYLLVPDTEACIYLTEKNIVIECPQCKNDSPHTRFIKDEGDDGKIEIVHITDEHRILDDFEWNCRCCGVSHKYEMDLAMNSDRMREEYKVVIALRLVNLIESNDSYKEAIDAILNLSTTD